METKVLTPAEVAKMLRVSAETVRNWCRSGELPSMKVGRQYRIAVADFEAFKASRCLGGSLSHPVEVAQ